MMNEKIRGAAFPATQATSLDDTVKYATGEVKKSCDFVASIPMKGEIDSLNASVAMGVLAYEIVRQRGL